MLRKMTHAALLAGVLLAPSEALAGGRRGDWAGGHHDWRGGHDRLHGGWGDHEAYRSGCWRWWYGQWVWAC